MHSRCGECPTEKKAIIAIWGDREVYETGVCLERGWGPQIRNSRWIDRRARENNLPLELQEAGKVLGNSPRGVAGFRFTGGLLPVGRRVGMNEILGKINTCARMQIWERQILAPGRWTPLWDQPTTVWGGRSHALFVDHFGGLRMGAERGAITISGR